MAAYKRAIALEPDNDRWVYHLAAIYNELGQPEAALREYQRAIAPSPKDYNIQAALADFYRQENRPAGAMAHYQPAIYLANQYLQGGENYELIYRIKVWREALQAMELEK